MLSNEREPQVGGGGESLEPMDTSISASQDSLTLSPMSEDPSTSQKSSSALHGLLSRIFSVSYSSPVIEGLTQLPCLSQSIASNPESG